MGRKLNTVLIATLTLGIVEAEIDRFGQIFFMQHRFDLPLAPIFVACHEYYLTNQNGRGPTKRSQTYKEVQKALTKTLQAMAALHAPMYPGYQVDKDHAGYVIKLEAPMLFRVPYHVLPTFPTGRELSALWQLSRVVRSGDRSTISISGSNVMRKMFDHVGDVDFCEYLPIEEDVFDRIAANIQGTDRIACVKLALAGKQWRYPWGQDKPNKEFFAETICCEDKDRSSMKFDYVGDIDHLGVAEITNVIIALDKDGDSASLSKTFAAQEAPLVPIDRLPNQMNDPFEMGRYIDWLKNSIETLSLEGDMRKCLKRCASLSRVLFIPTITDAIADLAETSSILLSYKLNELAELSTMLNAFGDARSVRLAELIEKQTKQLDEELVKKGGAPDAHALRKFDEESRRIAKQLLEHLQPGRDPSSKRAA